MGESGLLNRQKISAALHFAEPAETKIVRAQFIPSSAKRHYVIKWKEEGFLVFYELKPVPSMRNTSPLSVLFMLCILAFVPSAGQS